MKGMTLVHHSWAYHCGCPSTLAPFQLKPGVQFKNFNGVLFTSLNLGIGIKVTTVTRSRLFFTSSKNQKFVPYSTNNLFLSDPRVSWTLVVEDYPWLSLQAKESAPAGSSFKSTPISQPTGALTC